MFMISMFDEVRILKTGIVGTIIDSYNSHGTTVYIVESETPDGFELFDCRAEDIKRIG